MSGNLIVGQAYCVLYSLINEMELECKTKIYESKNFHLLISQWIKQKQDEKNLSLASVSLFRVDLHEMLIAEISYCIDGNGKGVWLIDRVN